MKLVEICSCYTNFRYASDYIMACNMFFLVIDYIKG